MFHINSHALKTSICRHASAEIDDVTIDLNKIEKPKTDNHLVIEGPRVLPVPLKHVTIILDLIKPEHKITETIIKKMSDVHILGSIDEETYFDKNVIKKYADKLKEKL